MPATIETTVYKFEELEDAAKERARDWFRESMTVDEWSDGVVDMAVEALEAAGVELETRKVQLMGGGHRYDPTIYWTLDRGYGLTFAGRVELAQWMKSQKIAGKFRALYNAAKAHDVAASIVRDRHGFNSETSTASMRGEIEIGHYPDTPGAAERLDKQAGDVETMLTEWARDQAGDILKNLRNEYDYQTADEQVDDNIIANEYTFTASGKRFG